MDHNFDPSALMERIRKLEKDCIKKARYERINQTLFKISNAINTTATLLELYGSIHSALGLVLDTNNFFIARYDRLSDTAVFPYCVDEVDGKLPPVKNFSCTASLTAEVIRTGNPLLLNKEGIISYRDNCPFPTPRCTPSEIWLGAPLMVNDETIGAIAVQSYTNSALYDETDKDVMVAVAAQVALAIERKTSEEKREALIKELHAALEEVKTLQGILPICSSCKKIRDDTGYWNRIETYIQEHSSAMFSHGLCPTCSDSIYGKEAWYQNLKEQEEKSATADTPGQSKKK